MSMKIVRENVHILVSIAVGALLGAVRIDPRIGISVLLILIYPLYKFYFEGKSCRWLIEYFGLAVTAWSIIASFVAS